MQLLLFFKIYRGDGLATFLSILGFFIRLAGVVFVASGATAVGVVAILLGLAPAIYAETR
ncbi:MAG: hypothetical protein Q4F17_07895 [Eubacteriales bacterium]|nr:hypothetical protein [Eubacteriales bacterium]